MTTLEIVTGDLTRMAVDAVVNAANWTLFGVGGVDGALHRAAGPGLLAACRARPEIRPGVRCETGDAVVTPGFRLAAPWVVHTVGPVWRGGAQGEARLLTACYRRSLQEAARMGARSVAFPAISCGVYGYPLDEAAHVVLWAVSETVEAMPGAFDRVVFCAFGADVRRALEAARGV